MFYAEGYINKKRLAFAANLPFVGMRHAPDALGQPHLKGKNYGS